MKTLLLIITIFALSSCTIRPPMNQADEFDCNQKCGYYDVKMNPFIMAQCLNQCRTAKEY